VVRKDAELLDELSTYEKLRRQAMDAQAMREISEARACMAAGEFVEAVRHYGIASKLLNDSPASRALPRVSTRPRLSRTAPDAATAPSS
jgi:hypothetical protein